MLPVVSRNCDTIFTAGCLARPNQVLCPGCHGHVIFASGLMGVGCQDERGSIALQPLAHRLVPIDVLSAMNPIPVEPWRARMAPPLH
jgi:hypothetical protein